MTQDAPIQDGSNDATLDQKLAGLVEQMQFDVRSGAAGDVDRLLSDRLRDAGIELDAEQRADLRVRIGALPEAK